MSPFEFFIWLIVILLIGAPQWLGRWIAKVHFGYEMKGTEDELGVLKAKRKLLEDRARESADAATASDAATDDAQRDPSLRRRAVRAKKLYRGWSIPKTEMPQHG